MILSQAWLAIRSLFWMAALPGFFGFYVPWRYFGLSTFPFSHDNPVHVLGFAVSAAGALLLLVCIWEFATRGRGTLSALDPPRRLVVRGPYRFVRNPMYLAVTTIVVGELILLRSGALLTYWLAWFAGVNLFVMGYEEPTLERRFGDAYRAYKTQVPRWLPRRPGRPAAAPPP